MTSRGFPHLTYASLLTSGLLASCGGGDGGGGIEPPPTPAAVTPVSGNGQTGPAGAVLADPLRVRVTSSAGGGLEGISVSFAAGATSGTVSSTMVVTDVDGMASITWTVGTGPGQNVDTVRASVSGVSAPAVFTASVTAAAPASLTSVSGDAQNGAPGQPLAQPLVVVVRDEFGNPNAGVTVTWTVTAGGGVLSGPTSSTGADGYASIGWTPGAPGPNTVQAAVAGLTGSPVSFAATVIAVATQLSIVSGDNQRGAPGSLLAEPLVALLRTDAGAPVSGVSVLWAATVGGGTVSQPSVPTDAQGRSSVTWTLGPATGAQSVTATVAGAAGSPVAFDAVAEVPAGTVTIASVVPSPIVEGQTATLTGSGFSSTASGNAVTIGGVTSSVTSATATSLTVSVPQFDCQPARSVAVQVRVGTQASNVISHPLNPAAFTSVAVGQQLLLQNPAEFCLQLAASSAPEDYLVGVQSTSEVVTSVTPAKLTALTGAATARVEPLAELSGAVLTGASRPPAGRRAARIAAHRRAELTLRAAERRNLSAITRAMLGGPPAPSSYSKSIIPPDLEVGDFVPIRVPDARTDDPCENYVQIVTIVRAVGTRGVWLEDITNPVGGYTAADFQMLSDLLDTRIYSVDADYFGAPTDVDGNGRLGVVITNAVNQFAIAEGAGTLGFVLSGDLAPRALCETSNEGELFYGIAPDPTGIFSYGPLTREEALQDQPFIIAHEFVHTIQFGRRILGTPPLDLPPQWFLEGQATLAEEVVGFAVEGRAIRSNYGTAIAFNEDDPSSTDWYSNKFFDLLLYYGFTFDDPDRKVLGAPEECSWLDNPPANAGPCETSFRSIYLSWSLLRWMADQYGPSFPGGEQGLQQAFLSSPAVGYSSLATVSGTSINSLLAGWAASLYTDDRVPGLDPKLTLPSWNLFEIFDESLRETARLVPRPRGFTNFSDDFRVRAGSSAYFRISGNSRPATAVRIRNGSGGPLPSIMQVFVVRLR